MIRVWISPKTLCSPVLASFADSKLLAVLPDQFSNCSCKEIILFIDLPKNS